MNDVMIEVPSDVSEVSDLRSVSLAELLADPATAAVRARVIPAPTKASIFSVGASNSCI
jgi:hypothetical protein